MLGAIIDDIAEAAYGVLNDLAKTALSFLDAPLLEVYYRWCTKIEEIRSVT